MLIGGWQGRIQKFLQYRGRKHFLRRKAAVPVPHTQSDAMPLQKKSGSTPVSAKIGGGACRGTPLPPLNPSLDGLFLEI